MTSTGNVGTRTQVTGEPTYQALESILLARLDVRIRALGGPQKK